MPGNMFASGGNHAYDAYNHGGAILAIKVSVFGR